MSSTYTDLGIELIVTGAADGTWGTKTNTADANVTPTGIQLQSNTGSPNITSWEEIDPGVSNVWTEVDLAA